MRRRGNEDEERLLPEERMAPPMQEKAAWDHFETFPREINTGSMADQKMFIIGEQIMKMVTFIVTFIVVLTAAVISKGTLLFMTSQISNHTTPYCNTLISKHKQFVVTLPRLERMQWMWMLLFAYFVPQAGIFVRSLRICLFKKWKLPSLMDFAMVMLTETLPALGSAILVYSVLPELDVIKGAMLTNAVCFVPAVVGFLCRSTKCPSNTLYMVLDVVSIVAQASSFVVWPLIEGKPVLWLIPVSVIFISFGYWENFVSDESPIRFIQKVARAKKVFEGSRYFIYLFVSLWKCLVFFTTMVVIVYSQEGQVDFMFKDFKYAFAKHQIFVNEVKPIIGSSNIPNITELISVGKGTFVDSDYLVPVWVWLINICTTYAAYIFGKFACKVLIQEFSYAFPINLAMPVTLSALIAVSGVFVRNECYFQDTIPFYLFFKVPPVHYLKDFLGNQQSWIWLIWLLSQTWITIHIWNPTCERLERTERLYVRPMYEAFIIDQDLALNRRRDDRVIPEIKEDDINKTAIPITREEYDNDRIPKVYACGTMWHEEEAEMVEFLKSILRLDADQCARRISRDYWRPISDYYELETHILFDNAFDRYEIVPDKNHPDKTVESDPYINEWVKKLIKSVNDAATKVHGVEMELDPPQKCPTPYGGQLIWTLPGQTKMIAHLKDANKIRKKKRWSQVMYMYYLLGHKLMSHSENEGIGAARADVIAENTFILALDGDIDFQPSAVLLLINLMKKNKSLGAACGRIHPIGSGPMVWYQMFEYAVGHWLQKATEHMIGCVLCSPGCFSLFRGKALMDVNVMNKYTTRSTEAQHFVQFDQGEDRWLCTLLLQRGYRVEYSAASDAYTHCPESFNEFYNQRRRWMPSTTANILDLLMDYKHVIKMNENISRLYIGYQVVLMVGTVLGPGTIFLMLVGAFVAAFQMDQWSSFLWNAVPILFFMLICKLFEKDTIQLFFAAVISAIYGLVMMAVLVGVMLQISNDGPLAPSSLFFFCVAGEMIITAFLHPKEINCLPYGIIYYVTVPSMYMLLVIYSIFNMNNVSWGTREVAKSQKIMEEDSDDEKDTPKIEEKQKVSRKDRVLNILGRGDETSGSLVCTFAGLFKCLWCTVSTPTEEQIKLNEIKSNIDTIMKRLDQMTQGVSEVQEEEPRPTPAVAKRETIILEGENATEKYRLYNCTVKNGKLYREEYPEAWMDDEVLQKCETVFTDNDEEDFWKQLLTKYLAPIDDSDRKEEISKNLRDLRDKSVGAFFMLNSLFVLVVFLLTLKKELLHIKWPFDVKTNFTYNNDVNQIRMTKQYLQLEPIGLVFLVFFALLLVVQFIAMLFHRFNTFCQIMSNTTLDFSWLSGKNSSARVEATNPIDTIKQLQTPRNDEEDVKEETAGRRMTVANLMQKAKQPKKVNKDLTENFVRRATQLQLGKYKGNLPTKLAEEVRRNTVLDLRRKTVIKKPNLDEILGANVNLGFVGDTNS